MIVVTRVPTHRNDGSKVSRKELLALLDAVQEEFGGYALEGPFPGAWVARDGKVHREKTHKLEVVVSKRKVKKACAMFRNIGAQLGQKAIYLEVRESGEIIDLE